MGLPRHTFRQMVKALALLLAVGAALAAAVAGHATSGAARPTLALVKSAPVTVQGRHFKARERVRVTFSAGGAKTIRNVRAGSTGSFVAAASEEMQHDRCGDLLLVLAEGREGSHASLKYPLPECPPAP